MALTFSTLATKMCLQMDAQTVTTRVCEGKCGEYCQNTPPKFNSWPLKIDGWKTSLSYWGCGHFSGENSLFKLREGILFSYSGTSLCIGQFF